MTEKYLLKNGADVVKVSHSVEVSGELTTVQLNEVEIARFQQGPTSTFPDNAVVDEERRLVLRYIRGPEGNFFEVFEGDRRLIGLSALRKAPLTIARVVFWYELISLALYSVLFVTADPTNSSVFRIVLLLGALYSLVIFVTAARLKANPEEKRLKLLYRLCLVEVVLSAFSSILGARLGPGLVVFVLKVVFLVYFDRRKSVFADLRVLEKEPGPAAGTGVQE